MMVLYVCEQCGRWQDVSIGTVIANAWNNVVKNNPDLQVATHDKQGVVCPEGHGLMKMVTMNDRLAIRPEEEQSNAATSDTEAQETSRPVLTVVRE